MTMYKIPAVEMLNGAVGELTRTRKFTRHSVIYFHNENALFIPLVEPFF